jgi:hypothetical protein
MQKTLAGVLMAVLMTPAMALAAAGVELGDDFRPMKKQAPLSVDEAMAKASALSLVEVAGITQHDNRAADGPLSDKIELKVVRSSGVALPEIEIIRAESGFNPQHDTKSHDPYHPHAFKVGDKIWILKAGAKARYSHDILMWFRADDKECPAEKFEAAVKEDRYAWSPQLVPGSEFSYGYKIDMDKSLIHVRVMKGEKEIWKKEVKYNGEQVAYPDMVIQLWNKGEGPEPVDGGDTTRLITIDTWYNLAEQNEYGAPRGKHHITWAFDFESGKLAQVEVENVVQRRYSLKTGKLAEGADKK